MLSAFSILRTIKHKTINPKPPYLAPMLQLNSISLFQFKCYTQQSFQFTERIIGICGKNGVGKTNLLDAIHYLCFTKSYFTRLDANNVQQGKDRFPARRKFCIA